MADKPTIQDVLWQFYPRYLEKYTPNARQAKSAVHILNCKTGAYGVNVSRCGQCGHIQIHNNSCRDRSCPMCQALSNELWVDAQNEHVLDEVWCNPWKRSIASTASFVDLFRQTLAKCSSVYHLLNCCITGGSSDRETALPLLLNELGNYSYHSGLPVS